MKWKAYPGHKPSGVDWLGEVPEDWGMKRLKYCAQLINEKVEGRDTDLPYIGLEHIESWTGKRIVTAEPSSGEGQSNHIRIDDVLFGKLRPYLAKVLRTSEEGICTGELLVLKPKCVIQDFLFYYMLSKDFISVVDSSTYGAKMPRASWEFIGNLPTLVPSQDEQHVIAAFLDRETGRIDALNGKKQRQIELLQEKRTAIISHAVTKGLDPNVKMEDSGVEWLGHVPAHWEPKRLKLVAKIQTGLTLGKDYKDVPTISRPYLRVANVQDGYLDLNDITEIFIPKGDTKRHELKQGDVLMTEGGDFDKLGRGYIWEGQIDGCLHQNHIFAVRPNPKYLASRYLAMLMTSSYSKAYFTSTSQQTTNLATTNITKLKNILLPLPNIQEQCLILDWLGENISQIDGLITKVQESLDRLKEYRTALISLAVTGKIDIRGEVRKAPAAFQRIVLAAEILDRLHNDPNFHRVKFQKVLYLCEHHLGIDLQGNYWRQAAGPLDNRMLYSI